MGRPKLGAKYKKPTDYKYDYPEQRILAKDLLSDDKVRIAELSGYSISYIKDWCVGTRKNAVIERYARIFVKINIACILKKKSLLLH
jgi:peroxiredoxin